MCTINEFVDISKYYSTPNSKVFVNGLLDRILQQMVKDGKKKVRVYNTEAVWYGMTYREDKDKVKSALAKMVEDGMYPKELWA